MRPGRMWQGSRPGGAPGGRSGAAYTGGMRLIRVPARTIVLLASAFAAALLLLPLLGAPALAHSALTGAVPGEGDQLASTPGEVTLTFNEDITDLGTEVIVTGPNGDILSAGKVEVEGPTITQRLVSSRPAGAYTVTWRAVSADGHPISGEYTFTSSEDVGGATPTGDAAETETEAPEETTPAVEVGHETTDSPVLKWAIVLGGAAAFAAIVAVVIQKRRRDLGQ
ncbi:hypothetical protein GCG21_02880 [Pseudactinotalea sp. HY160]|nr:hypothetical protein [Pseudactinotalea sp. HY160]